MTQNQALTHFLILALVAPDDERSQRAVKMAEQFASGLNRADVEQCKADALVGAETWGQV
jgi:hypothetical protein